MTHSLLIIIPLSFRPTQSPLLGYLMVVWGRGTGYYKAGASVLRLAGGIPLICSDYYRVHPHTPPPLFALTDSIHTQQCAISVPGRISALHREERISHSHSAHLHTCSQRTTWAPKAAPLLYKSWHSYHRVSTSSTLTAVRRFKRDHSCCLFWFFFFWTLLNDLKTCLYHLKRPCLFLIGKMKVVLFDVYLVWTSRSLFPFFFPGVVVFFFSSFFCSRMPSRESYEVCQEEKPLVQKAKREANQEDILAAALGMRMGPQKPSATFWQPLKLFAYSQLTSLVRRASLKESDWPSRSEKAHNFKVSMSQLKERLSAVASLGLISSCVATGLLLEPPLWEIEGEGCGLLTGRLGMKNRAVLVCPVSPNQKKICWVVCEPLLLVWAPDGEIRPIESRKSGGQYPRLAQAHSPSLAG